jgi:hypothetical protein
VPWDRNKVWRMNPDVGARVDTSATIVLEIRR